VCACASAQQYPSRPLRWIAPFAPGGGSDLTTRLVAQRVSELIGQQIVVDNRTGASGNIGAELAARAPADGHTLVTITASYPANHAVADPVSYDLVRDFAYITQLTTQPYILLVHPSIQATNVKELIAVARKAPRTLNYGSSGVATLQHMAGVMLGSMSGTELMHVPYKGGALVLTDIVGGRLQVFFGVILSSMPHIKSGKLRPLAVTSTRRSQSFPELPTIAEAGLPGYVVDNWYTVAAPAKTPPATLARLHTEMVRALKTREVDQRLRADGSEPVGNTPAEMVTIVRNDLQRWRKYVKEAGIKPES
jgi:tripartite-type tricarboxylate transporter receptor subunit TctC